MGGRKWVYSRDEEIPDAAWNDLDQLCDIVAETVNDFKRLDK
jgi:predicted transcriptional regulator